MCTGTGTRHRLCVWAATQRSCRLRHRRCAAASASVLHTSRVHPSNQNCLVGMRANNRRLVPGNVQLCSASSELFVVGSPSRAWKSVLGGAARACWHMLGLPFACNTRVSVIYICRGGACQCVTPWLDKRACLCLCRCQSEDSDELAVALARPAAAGDRSTAGAIVRVSAQRCAEKESQ